MRNSLTLVLLFGLAGAPAAFTSHAQITGGNETVQDAIRFERAKDAADARQARIETQRERNSTADREVSAEKPKSSKTRRSRPGSANRTAPQSADQQKQQQR